ncbi:MAG: AAA family ATPase [Gammaproteobacteria bacterium]|nr:AAA family ATPase [Gammaproteobacteria bacterium]
MKPRDAATWLGIEEPESALHPAAAGVLIDSLTDASQLAQVVVTSHSADLLDSDAIPDSAIPAVLSEHAETRIGPLDEDGRSALRDHLFTAGELLRKDQLRPDPEQAAPASSICSRAPADGCRQSLR